MQKLRRREFIKMAAASLALGSAMGWRCSSEGKNKFRGKILTVTGPIDPQELGPTLPHEHIMVDFIGADQTGPHRWDAEEVFRTMLPYLQSIRALGVTAFIDCTPDYLGRDVIILKRLAQETGLHILTNTGFYKEPYLPRYAFDLSAEQLANKWIAEILQGIPGSDVHAGFIKIAVFRESLKPMQQKIVRAACKTHNATGATIACHTGHGPAALEILDLMREENTPSDALVVVHMNSEKDRGYHYQAAERGAWLEYDNIGSWPVEQHLALLQDMCDRGYADQLLLSMDRGWYQVGEPAGGVIKSFDYLFAEFIPLMREAGFADQLIHQLTTTNPAKAFQIDA